MREGNLVCIYGLGSRARMECLKLADRLRNMWIPATILYNVSLKSAIRQADKMEATDFVVIGDNELKDGVVSWKNMKTGDLSIVGITKMINSIMSRSWEICLI